MRIKNFALRLKQLESKLPDFDHFNEQQRDEAIRKVMDHATVEELRIAVGFDRNREIPEEETQKMLETLSKRADELLKKK